MDFERDIVPWWWCCWGHSLLTKLSLDVNIRIAFAGSMNQASKSFKILKIFVFVSFVLVPPSFTASPADTIARVGESTFFQCKSDGNPTPTITWTTPTTSTLLAPSGLHSGVEVSADGTLTVSPVDRRHAGSYVCTATNSVSVISQSATLEVQSKSSLY